MSRLVERFAWSNALTHGAAPEMEKSMSSALPLGVTPELQSAMGLLAEGYFWVWERLPDGSGEYEVFEEKYKPAMDVLNMMAEEVVRTWKRRIPDCVRDANVSLFHRGATRSEILHLLTADPWDDGTSVWNEGNDVTVAGLGRRFQWEVTRATEGQWRLDLDFDTDAEGVVVKAWPDRSFTANLEWVCFLIESRPMHIRLRSEVSVGKKTIRWRVWAIEKDSEAGR